MDDSKVFMFPENKGVDYAALSALNNNGFGNNPFWMIFMLPFLYPFFNMFGGFGGWNGFGNNGTGFLANQLNNDSGRDLILQAINGRADALSSLAGILNTDIATVSNGINTANLKLTEIGSTVGLTGLQVINAIQSGNTALARQLRECCCENRLLTTQQGYESRIATIEQTNQLGSQADRNTRSITDAIAALQTNMTREFCDVRERELQDKLDTANAENIQLKNQIDNAAQTANIAAMMSPLKSELEAIKAAQPATTTIQYPQIVGYPSWLVNGYGSFAQTNFWN